LKEGDIMSTEQNRIIARRYIEEIWSDAKLEAADELINEDFIFHGPIREVEGLEAFKQFVAAIHSTFPDISFTIEDLVAEEEKVVFRWTMTGTHNNEFMGIAATGKHFTVSGATIARVSGEKLREACLYWDRLGMVEQLGATLASR
jgi:steroid delta-isomerase-like uncharacterized protein